MARSGTFSSLGTTRTTYFRSDIDFKSGNNPTASSGVSAPGDGVPTKGFRVKAAAANTTNVLVYVNGKLSGTIEAGDTQEFITTNTDRTASGGRLELAAASSTVAGTFGTID